MFFNYKLLYKFCSPLLSSDHRWQEVLFGLPLTCFPLCLQMAHDALNAPLHILRAIYELQMKRTDSFFLEVQKRWGARSYSPVLTDEDKRMCTSCLLNLGDKAERPGGRGRTWCGPQWVRVEGDLCHLDCPEVCGRCLDKCWVCSQPLRGDVDEAVTKTSPHNPSVQTAEWDILPKGFVLLLLSFWLFTTADYFFSSQRWL